MSGGEYLTRKREADLLSCILVEGADPATVDRIVCELIDTGLCDDTHGPRAQVAWEQVVDSLPEDDLRKVVIDSYMGVTSEEEDE